MNISYNNNCISKKERRIREFLDKKRIAGDFRTVDFFRQWFLKKRFKSLNHDDVEKFCSQIQDIINILNSKYEQNWDFHIQPIVDKKRNRWNNLVYDGYGNYIYDVFGYEVYILILYPEINIKNSNDHTLNLKDLIVSIKLKSNQFNYNEITFEKPSGNRTTLTFDEYSSYYLHSHLPSTRANTCNALFEMYDFCIGKETELELLLTSVWDDNYIFSDIIFESLLYGIDSLVEWESIEGTPYISIDDIKFNTKNKIRFYMDKSNMKEYYNKIRNVLLTLIQRGEKINFIFSEGKYSVKEDEDFHNLLKHAIFHDIATTQKTLYTRQVESNPEYCFGFAKKLFNTETGNLTNIYGEEPHVTIQDKTLTFNITTSADVTEIKQELKTYKIIPNFVEYAIQQLNKDLHTKSIRKDAVESYN